MKKKIDNHAELMRFFLIALSIIDLFTHDRCNQIQVISVLIFYNLNQNFLQIPLTVLIHLLQDKGKVRIPVSIKTFKIKKNLYEVKIMYKTCSCYTCTTCTYSFNSAFYHTKPYLPRFIQLDKGKHVNPEIIWSRSHKNEKKSQDLPSPKNPPLN